MLMIIKRELENYMYIGIYQYHTTSPVDNISDVSNTAGTVGFFGIYELLVHRA